MFDVKRGAMKKKSDRHPKGMVPVISVQASLSQTFSMAPRSWAA